MQGWKVEGLITIHITNDDSMMFQIPNTSIAGLQAHSMGVPWLPILSDGKQEEEISDLENGINVIYSSMTDAKAAVRFFRKEYAELDNPYGIDQNQIWMGGNSAGACLGLHMDYITSLDRVWICKREEIANHWIKYHNN